MSADSWAATSVGDARWPKYKNPPTTLAYDKSVNLYRPLPAPVDPYGQVVVVEGTLDALAIAVVALKAGKAGLFCPVTQSGRELSEHQIRRIISIHPGAPVLAFDSDSAGTDSAFRYSLCFAAYGTAVTVTDLGADHDPASWVAEHGNQALSAWSRNNHSRWDGPAPIPASTFAARYIHSQDRSRAERMEALVEVANLATRLPGRTARLWAERVGAIAGPAAVAEAHEQLLASLKVEAPKPAHQVDLANWQPEPATQTESGFDAVIGPGATGALIERVATWGRRLPRVGDPGFIRCASASIDAAGSLGATEAGARLNEVLGRIERSIDPLELPTPVRTTEAIGL